MQMTIPLIRGRLAVIVILLLLAACAKEQLSTSVSASQPADSIVVHGSHINYGVDPAIRISGLDPRRDFVVASMRNYEYWEPAPSGGWEPGIRSVIAWGAFRSRADGTIDLATHAPSAGTWAEADAYGILNSGRRQEDLFHEPLPSALLATAPARADHEILVIDGANIAARAPLTFGPAPGLVIETVSEGQLNGAFAYLAGARALPVIIILHGSEGGNVETARATAARFAGSGYAAFAMNYFAWTMAGIDNIPSSHMNFPIERLGEARAWLAARPEADVERLAIHGTSKGAEFALVAAERYSWIDGVIACVGTDAVWEGYGVGDPRSRTTAADMPEIRSSWSWRGEPLPYIPLEPWEDGRWYNNTERYEHGRETHPQAAQRAAIDITRSPARFLVIGSLRDEVWASGAMARNLEGRMQASGRAEDIESLVFERAGHGVCGDGTYPPRAYSESSSDPRAVDLDAEARASVSAWHETRDFLRRLSDSREVEPFSKASSDD